MKRYSFLSLWIETHKFFNKLRLSKILSKQLDTSRNLWYIAPFFAVKMTQK